MKARTIAILALALILFIQSVVAIADNNTTSDYVKGTTVDIIEKGNSTMTTIVNDSTIVTTISNTSYAVVTSYTDQLTGEIVNTTKTFMREQFGIFNESEYPIQRIDQGQCVQIGRTYDISGLGWWTGKLAYYGQYTYELAPDNSTVKVATKDIPYTKAGLTHFFIDPAFFRDKQGYWYVDYNKNERAANNRIFYVSSNCSLISNRSDVIIKPTEIVNDTKQNVTLSAGSWHLKPRVGNGVVVARGDPLPFYNTSNATTTSHIWIFGTSNWKYDFNYSGGYIDDGSIMSGWEEGSYTVASVSGGKNELYEEQYDNVTDSIVSPFVGKPHINLTGIQPRVALERFEEYVNGTIDDTITKYDIDFQDAKIYLTQLEQHPYATGVSYLEISGYTNCANNTKILFDLDTYQTSTKAPVNTTASAIAVSVNNNPNEWRQFHAFIPIYFFENKPGEHFIMARTETGAKATAQFWIREELPANYVDPGTIRWVDNSPYLEPEIIVKETIKEVPVIQEKTVYVKEPVDYEKLAEEEISRLLPIVVSGIAALILAVYLFSVAVRTHERRKRNSASPYDYILSVEDLYED